MRRNTPTALTKTPELPELWGVVGSKLKEPSKGRLPSKQSVVGSNPTGDALTCALATHGALQPKPVVYCLI
jgi:hypothetical protein